MSETQQKPLSPQEETQMSKCDIDRLLLWHCIDHLVNGSVLPKLDANSQTEKKQCAAKCSCEEITGRLLCHLSSVSLQAYKHGPFYN